MVQRQLSQVAEVLNVHVGRHGADEYGLVLEGVREGVRNTNRHDDDGVRFNCDFARYVAQFCQGIWRR